MDEFFPETFRLDTKDEREIFFDIYRGEPSPTVEWQPSFQIDKIWVLSCFVMEILLLISGGNLNSELTEQTQSWFAQGLGFARHDQKRMG